MDDEEKQKKLEGLKARAKMSKSSMNGKWSKEKNLLCFWLQLVSRVTKWQKLNLYLLFR